MHISLLDYLFCRHVEIVHKHNTFLSDRRPVKAFAPSINLGHDDVLRLRRRSSGREIDIVGDILIFRQVNEVVVGDRGLSGT